MYVMALAGDRMQAGSDGRCCHGVRAERNAGGSIRAVAGGGW
jgi:hypothetical protein